MIHAHAGLRRVVETPVDGMSELWRLGPMHKTIID
jgi:hypothetical protein